MKIYDKNNIEILDIDVDDSSVRYRSIMNDDSLTLHFSTTSAVAIPRGAYVEFEGARYTLFYPENFKKHSTRNFEYTLILHGWREALKLYKYKDLSAKPYRLKFPLTAKPSDFLKLLVDCMNLHDAGWSAGDCIVSDEKLVSFNHEYCFDVLNRIATEFNTEWEIAGKTIHLRKVEKFKDDPLPLSYGMGNGFKTGVGRSNDGDRQPIGLLYVQGGERNIDYSNYGSSSLLLPKSATLVYDGKTYRTDLDGMYITRDGNTNIAEDSYDGSSHYPKRVGTVSHVIVVDAEKHFYDIRDTSIPDSLNYRDCRIEGEKATIVFQSGALAGREFDLEQTDSELTGYIHAERRFKIVPAELDGITMPGGVFVPKTGDKYAIFNISMPAAYISDNPTQTGASWDMFREAVRYFADEEKDKFSFVGDLDGVWSRFRWLEIGGKIVPGGHVLFSDPQFQPDGVLIRITAIKDYVNSPHKPEITLSNASVTGSFSADLGKIEAGEVVQETNKKEVMHFAKRQWRDAKETMEMIQNAMLDFGEGINPITINTMMMLVGDSSLQFYFKEDHKVTWNKSTKQLSVSAGTIMTIENEKTITTSISAGTQAGYFPAYISPALTEKSTAYYLYARFSISGSYFFLTTETYKSEPEYQSYYYLIGILNSEQTDGDRSFVRLHGITEILPGRINTEKIVSADGKTYFDLSKGVIGGRIRFLSSGVETDIEDWAEGVETKITDAISVAEEVQTSVDNLGDYVNGAFKDGVIDSAEAKAIEKYINTINEVMAKAEASYNKVYANTYLEGTAKTNLLNAKINLWGQRDTLMSAINNAIADGKTTVAEKTAVDNAFNAFNTLMSAFQNALEDAGKAIQAKLDAIAKDYASDIAKITEGKMLYKDPTFKTGMNGIYPYNNASETSVVTLTRITKPADAPTDSSHILRFSYVSGTPSPGFGGFSFQNQSRANAVFLAKIIAKIPIGKTISNNQNAYGTGGVLAWLTSQAGTGKYETYMFKCQCGSTGTFSSINFFSFHGGSGAFDIDIAYATVFDLTLYDDTADKALAVANEKLARSDQFGWEVDGAFMMGVLMYLREVNTQSVTGGISGIQGDDKELPAFWAGGTYAEAIAKIAKIILNHDGSGQLAGGKTRWDVAGNMTYSGLTISPFELDPWYYLSADGRYYIDLERSNNVIITSLPNGSNTNWFQTYLPTDNKYNGLTLNILWLPAASGYHWRIIRQGSQNIISTTDGVDYKIDLTSDTKRYVSITAYWENNTLKWVVTNNIKIGQAYEDRVKAGEIFLTATTLSNGGLLKQSSKFGFTCNCVKAAIGTYTVTINRSPVNPIASANFTPMVCGFNGTFYAVVKSVSSGVVTVHTADDATANDSAFSIILIANEDIDLRDQYINLS